MILDAIVRPFTTASTDYVNVGVLLVAPRGFDEINFLIIGDNGTVQILNHGSQATGSNSNAATTAPSSIGGATFSVNANVSGLIPNFPQPYQIKFKSNDGNTATLYSLSLIHI